MVNPKTIENLESSILTFTSMCGLIDRTKVITNYLAWATNLFKNTSLHSVRQGQDYRNI